MAKVVQVTVSLETPDDAENVAGYVAAVLNVVLKYRPGWKVKKAL